MSMFAGLSNQITGFVAQKMGKGEEGAGGEAGEVPVEGVEGEVPVEGEAAAGGAMGFAQGLMMKAAMAKDGLKEKASGLNAGNLTGIGAMAGGVMGQVQGIIPGMRKEEEVPEPAPPQEEYQEYQEEQQYTE